MENSAANRRKIADAGYKRAGEMIQGSGVVTEGPIFDDSPISASDVENTGLSLFPSIEKAGQDFLFGESCLKTAKTPKILQKTLYLKVFKLLVIVCSVKIEWMRRQRKKKKI